MKRIIDQTVEYCSQAREMRGGVRHVAGLGACSEGVAHDLSAAHDATAAHDITAARTARPQRKVFGKPVLANQAVRFKLAELKTEVRA